MNIEETVWDQDNLKLKFFKRVFEKCERVRVLLVPFDGDGSRPIGDEIKGLLGLISHSPLSKLTVLSISDWHIQPPDTSSHDLTISMDLKNSEYYHQALEILLVKCDAFKRNHQVFVSIKSYQCQDLSTLI